MTQGEDSGVEVCVLCGFPVLSFGIELSMQEGN